MLIVKPLESLSTPEGARGFFTFATHPIDPTREAVRGEFDGAVRHLSASVMSMAQVFGYDLERREKLNHDCGVFSRACTTGETYDGIRFYKGGIPNNYRLSEAGFLVPDEIAEAEASVAAGESLCSRFFEKSGEESGAHHFITRASVDDGQPLYASKFTSHGLVLVHNIQASLYHYPSHTLNNVTFLP